ncbi:hypothetical protein LIA77_06163 [Sarocladium implicatum]|nr:hypothetical protein LIA77_06163 [Sarocladium implicatum]
MEQQKAAAAALAKSLGQAAKLTEILDPDEVFCREIAKAEKKRKESLSTYLSASRAERDTIHRRCCEAEDAVEAIREDWERTGPQKKAQYSLLMEATHSVLMDHIAEVARLVPPLELNKRFGCQWTLDSSLPSPPDSSLPEATFGVADEPHQANGVIALNTPGGVAAASGTSVSTEQTPNPVLGDSGEGQTTTLLDPRVTEVGKRSAQKGKRHRDPSDETSAEKRARACFWQPRSVTPKYDGPRSTAVDEIDYSEVWADGNPTYPCMIYNCLDSKGEDIYYIFRCDEHGITFAESAGIGAAKHLRGREHKCPIGTVQSAYDRLSIRVLNCTRYGQLQNNDMFRKRIRGGFQPAKRTNRARELVELYGARRGITSSVVQSAPAAPEEDDFMTGMEEHSFLRPRLRHNRNHASEILPGEVYQGWETNTWRPVVALPVGSLESIGLEGTLDSTGLLEKLSEYAATYDQMAGEFHRDQSGPEGNIRTRLYPVMRFDGSPSFPEESTVSLLELENLQNFDITNSSLNKDYYAQQALKYLATRGKNTEDHIEASSVSDESSNESVRDDSVIGDPVSNDAATDGPGSEEVTMEEQTQANLVTETSVDPTTSLARATSSIQTIERPTPAEVRSIVTEQSISTPGTITTTSASHDVSTQIEQQAQGRVLVSPSESGGQKEARGKDFGLVSIQAQAFSRRLDSQLTPPALASPSLARRPEVSQEFDEDDGNSSSGSDKIIVQPLAASSTASASRRTMAFTSLGPQARKEAHSRPGPRSYRVRKSSEGEATVAPRRHTASHSVSPLSQPRRPSPTQAPFALYRSRLTSPQKNELRRAASQGT